MPGARTCFRGADSHPAAIPSVSAPSVISSTMPLGPQERPRRPQDVATADDEATISTPTQRASQSLSPLNLSAVTPWQYPHKTHPRPTVKATRVIVTEYEPPRFDAMQHDVVVDP